MSVLIFQNSIESLQLRTVAVSSKLFLAIIIHDAITGVARVISFTILKFTLLHGTLTFAML
jgi:hypothetical protein